MNTVQIIINPKNLDNQQDQIDQIHKQIAEVFDKENIDLHITKPDSEIEISGNPDLLLVVGGDGTLTKVARLAIDSNLDSKLAVLPFGTANVVAKELATNVSIKRLLKRITNHDFDIVDIDVGYVNDSPFLIRVHKGITAIPIHANSRMSPKKSSFGMLNYLSKYIEHIFDAAETIPRFDFQCTINGERIQYSVNNMMINNIGSVGLGSFQYSNNIDPTDGLLNLNLFTGLGEAQAKRQTTKWNLSNLPELLEEKLSDKFEIDFAEETVIVVDDDVLTGKHFNIKLAERKLKFIKLN